MMTTTQSLNPTERSTFLIQVNGPANECAAAKVFAALERVDAIVETVDQVVMRDHLSLNIVSCLPAGDELRKELLLTGYELGLTIDFTSVSRVPAERTDSSILTLIGTYVGAAELAATQDLVARTGGDVTRVERLSRTPVWSYQLDVVGGDQRAIRLGLAKLQKQFPDLDVAIRSKQLPLRALRAVVLDVDRTLVQNEMIDEIADIAGVGSEVATITQLAMRGEIDFEDALRKRVSLLAGQPASILEEAWSRISLTPGAREVIGTLRRMGFVVALISGGFTSITDRLKSELDLDYAFANRLEVVDGWLTGDLCGPIVDRRRKADLLASIAQCERLDLSQIVAIGDGANDIDMLETAGLGIAFNAKRGVGVAADVSLNVPHLDALLSFLGIASSERVLAPCDLDEGVR
jgi:phosphoserine phosphatase